MDRPRCPRHALVLADGVCLRCRRDAERGTTYVLFGLLVGLVVLAIGAMVLFRGALALRDRVIAARTAQIQATNAPPPAPRPSAGAGTSGVSSREQAIAWEMHNIPVTIYSTDYCPWCRKAKAHMAERGIAYTERNIERSPEAKREMRRIGGRGVPTIEIEGDVNSGYNPEWVERVVRAHAERRVAALP